MKSGARIGRVTTRGMLRRRWSAVFAAGIVGIAGIAGIGVTGAWGTLAAQDVLITELVAWNDAQLADEDGEFSDWFELFNAGAVPVDLTGYKMTDDDADLAKWEFPAVTLLPGQFLVVFASGKDRRDPTRNLHTNFRLERNGEILVLLTPDASTVVSGYVGFPEQLPDVSYGLATDSTFERPLAAGDPVRVLVPTDGALGRAWTLPEFDDGTWRAGVSGVGLERASGYVDLIGTDVNAEMEDINASCYVRMRFDVADPTAIDVAKLLMKYDDGFVAYINGTRVASANAPEDGELVWDSGATGSHADRLAVEFQEFDLAAHVGILRAGTNVLAIHGLNFSTTSNDFLVLPEILLVDVGDVNRDLTLYFPVPTPGGPNGPGFAGVASRPEFSHDSGAFAETQMVELTADQAGATIRYTTTGTTPDESSPEYTGPIAVTGAVKIVARTFHPDLLPSTPESRVYAIVHPSAQAFTSNLPIVITNTFGRQIGSNCDGPYTPGFFMVIEPGENGRTRIIDEAGFADTAAFRRRGSSTCGRQKFSFNVEIQDEEGDDKDVSILGLGADADWIMYGPETFDRALMRNPLAFWMSRESGRWAPRTKFVELFLHQSAGAVTSASYHGLYVFMEKNKRSKDRVDIARLSESDSAEPEVSGGYIMKVDRQGAGEVSLSGGGQSVVMVYPKLPTSAQRTWLSGYLNQMRASLSPTTVVARDGEFIDVGAWIDHHILMTMPKNVDAFRLSGYMFKDREGPLQMGPIWDYDRSMGSTDGRDVDPLSWANTGGDGGTAYFAFGWYGVLFRNQPPMGSDPWAIAYRTRWRELRRGPLATENIHGQIDEWAALLSEAADRNFNRWSGVRPRNVFGGGFQGEVNLLKDWLARRGDWIDAQFVEAPRISPPGGDVEAPVRVEILIGDQSARLFYTLDDSDPRAPNASPSPGAIEYLGSFTLERNTRVKARAHYGGSLWSGLVQETFIFDVPRLVISEIHYNPLEPTPEEDPLDRFSKTNMEFVEIQNAGDVTVSLSNMRFARGVTFDFSGSAITELAPGELVVLVNSREAFGLRYDIATIPIGGEYGGSLSDRSEVMEIAGPLGESIVDFSYSDTWYTDTDGLGPSLELIDPRATSAANLGDPAFWRASERPHGTPGVDPSAGGGGLHRRGDADANQRLNVSDVVVLLRHLFGGVAGGLPCGDGSLGAAGNVRLLDADASGAVDVTDGIHLLAFLFQQGPPGALSGACERVEGCETDSCAR